MSKEKLNINKVVLAYSGGLDTSVIIKWLEERYGCHTIAVLVDLGQGEDMTLLKDKAYNAGAAKVIIKDVREEFLRDFCFPALAAHAIYEGKYLLATALGRPLIAKELVNIASSECADAIAHGATGKGNDQVRFDCSIMALAPDLKIIAPLRSPEWEFGSREEEIEYAKKHNIPVPVTKERPYSLDKNLWGISIECGALEDPWVEPPEDTFFMVSRIEETPDDPEYVIIGFEKGIPTCLDGKAMQPVRLIEQLNEIGGRHGIGRSDLVENRLVGIKSREIYEAPGATILWHAHRELEALVLDRETFHYKESIALKYSEIVYYGLWFSPLREALAAFIEKLQGLVNGEVRLRLYKGQCIPAGRTSPDSLYDLSLATYGVEDAFDHRAGEYFCQIWGLPLKVGGRVRNKKMKNENLKMQNEK
ncbi:MAG: argininosuccinate synthase [bacterium]